MKKRFSLVILSVMLSVAALFSIVFATIASAAEETETVATFELGSDGSATHNDGSTKTSYTETDGGYTLSVTGGTNLYTGARDAKGNGAFKLGSSSKTGSFNFTVPEDVVEVVIYVAKYKSNATKVSVNGVQYTISGASDSGAYDAITVDTSSNKTVSFTTVSGGVRAMVNTIEFKAMTSSGGGDTGCEHNYENGFCTECGEADPDYVPEFNAIFEVTDGAEAVETIHGSTIKLPEGSVPEAFADQYSFAGWSTTKLNAETTSAPTIYKVGSEYTLSADTTFYAVYSYSISGGDDSWRLVTNASSLGENVKVIIAAKGYNYALSTNQTSNNRGQAAITKSSNSLEFTSSVQELVLKSGSVSGTFAFYTGAGYLYAASSSSNYLRTEANLTANSSFKIEIAADGTATIIAQGSNTRNWLRYNSSNSLFACYGSGQADVVIYAYISSSVTYYTGVLEEADCEHVNMNSERVKEPSCTENGETKYTCADCGEYSYILADVEKLGHDYKCEQTKAPSCTEQGENTYDCSQCDSVYTEPIDKLAHVIVDGVCTECGNRIADAEFALGADGDPEKENTSSKTEYKETVGDFTLAITGGDKMYIGCTDGKGNSCIKIGSSSVAGRFTITVPDGIGKVVIYVAGYKANTAKISVNGANYDITTSSTDGEYTPIVVYTYESKTIEFSTLSGGTRAMIGAVEFYKEIPTKITGAALNAGVDLTLKYDVAIPEGDDISNYTMQFTMNGKTYTVKSSTMNGNKYVFAFTGIAPQDMGDLIDARLYKGDECVAEKLEYSVVKFAESFLETYEGVEGYEGYIALMGDLLAYGQAAKDYVDYKTDESVLVDGYSASTAFPTADDSIKAFVENVEGSGISFAGVGVRFGVVNQIYVKFEVSEAVDGEVTLRLDGIAVDADLVDGKYVYYTDGIYATDFDKAFTFTLEVDGETVQTLTYSVNSYAFSKASAETEMGRLAIALFRYGKSAEAVNR